MRALAALAARQHDLVTLAQLTRGGPRPARRSRSASTAACSIGATAGCTRVGHAALSREGEWLAAVLAMRRQATALESLVSGGAAHPHAQARLPHRRRFSAKTHPRPASASTRTRDLDPRDVTIVRGIPVTTIHRIFVDLVRRAHAARARRPDARGALPRPLRRARGPRSRWPAPTGRHNLAVLDRAIELFKAGSAGTRSGNEVLFLKLDLPEPLVNTKLHGYEADFHWPDLELNVEIDGPQHDRGRRRDP